MNSMLRAVCLLLLCCCLSACDSLGYYRQAIVGELSLLQQRRPLAEVLQDPRLNAATRHQLELVQSLRTFAAVQLQLPVKNHYSTYVDLKREFVVWNVFAAPEFSMQPQQWCYPVAGCASYRGYFAEAAARRFAGELKQQGLDTWVGGVSAYSTLGWFNDPVLSSMLRRDDLQLAGTIFHELAHQLLYVSGDTEFNESFATVVEQEGQQRWAQQLPDAADQLQAMTMQRQRQQQFVALVQGAVAGLQQLYRQNLPVPELRQRKAAQQADLRQRYAALKASWQGYKGYDQWFAGELNNAQLNTVTTYNQWASAFRHLLQQNGDDLPRFYAAAAKVARLDDTHRMQALQELSASK